MKGAFLSLVVVGTVAVVGESYADAAAIARGQQLYTTKICSSCHSLDGSRLVGPSFKGVYGREGVLTDGSKYVANDAYIKESIVNPTAKVPESYPPAMPPGLVTDDKEISDIIEFLKTVK